MAYYFRLPLIQDLTKDQQRALDEVDPIALSGGPGTGKSVVSLWRHIRNYSAGLQSSLLLTYTKTLEYYLKVAAFEHNENAGNTVGRTDQILDLTKNFFKYGEIIIDEAQDLAKEKLEEFFKYSNRISYGADKRQSIYRSKEELEELFEWLSNDSRFNSNVKVSLSRNFRNSKEILLFVRSVLPKMMIPQNSIDEAEEGLKPVLKPNLRGISEQINAIVDIVNDFQSDVHNIAILVPFVKNVDQYYQDIKDKLHESNNSLDVTRYHNKLETFEGLSGVHVTTFKSSKGTEFDTVIIPDFHNFHNYIDNYEVVNENDYFVALTRAKTNLFLLCGSDVPQFVDRNTVIIE